MKLPWRYTICCVLFTAGIAIAYIWCRKSAAPERMNHANLSLEKTWNIQREEAGPYITGVDSWRCERSHHDNQHDDNCGPFLTCEEIKEIELEKKIGEGAVKQVYLGKWQGMKVAYSFLTYPQHLEDFLHGAAMLQAMQPSEVAIRLLGLCLDADTPIIITEYHELGSAEKVNDILSNENFSERNTVRTRFRMCLDYAGVLSFLHSSPAGMRVMCDSNDIRKTLSQFLITNDLRLIVNDLDALPLVKHAEGKRAKCGHRELYGDFVAPEQLWPFPDESFRDEDMPSYDEKTDIWKVPDVTEALLGDVERSDIVKFHLFKIHRRCKALDPTLRPSAEEILEEYQEIFHSVIDDH